MAAKLPKWQRDEMARYNLSEAEVLAEDERRMWSLDQVHLFCKVLRREVGDGWRWMTAEVREAMVGAHAFNIVRSQDRVAVAPAAMHQLFVDMLRGCGLRSE